MFLALLAIASVQPEGVRPNCDGNTLEINACLQERLERAQKRLEDYVRAALGRHTDKEGKSDSVALGIQASQIAFDAYRAIECDSVYEDWKEGTIRNVMSLTCRIKLTDERTHTVWRNWLNYMDDTPPIRPEPKPTK